MCLNPPPKYQLLQRYNEHECYYFMSYLDRSIKGKISKDLKFPAEKAFAGHLRVPNPPFGMFL